MWKAKPSQSPKLDTEVELQSPPDAEVVSDQGVADSDWTVRARPWAQIEAISGGEVTIGDGSIGVQRYRVTIRWPGFRPTTSERIKVLHGDYAGSLLYIDAAAPGAVRSEGLIEMICREGRT